MPACFTLKVFIRYMKDIYRQMAGCFLLIVLGGCIQSSNLAQHPLEGKTVAIVSEIPGAPFADFDMTIFDRVGQEVPVFDRERPSSDIPPVVMENVELRERANGPTSSVHVLIDSVLVDFDMSARIISATHQHSASLIRFEAIEEKERADYILEVVVEDYGIGADAWQSTAYFEVMGSIKLIDNKSGKKV